MRFYWNKNCKQNWNWKTKLNWMRGRLNWTAARFINLLSRQKAADGQQEVLNKSQEWEREEEMGEKERQGVAVLSVKSNKILAHVPHTPTKQTEKGRVERVRNLGRTVATSPTADEIVLLPCQSLCVARHTVQCAWVGGQRAVEFRKMRARHSSRRWCCCKATARNEVASRVLQTNWNKFNYNCY